MKNIVFYLIIGILPLACENDGLSISLREAGANRAELESLLSYYQREAKDSLKYRAACFLLENMIDKYALSGYKLDEFYSFIDTVYASEKEVYNDKEYYAYFMEHSAYQSLPLDTLYDLKTIKASYLQSIIDNSFELWEKPWARHLNFQEFCELLLPYRVGNESIEDWHGMYHQRFDMTKVQDPPRVAIDACTAVNEMLIGYPIQIVHTSANAASMRPSTLINMKFGLCEDYAQLATYAMRSQGIPCAMEVIPAFGKGRSKHTFNVVYNDDHAFYNFSGGEQNPADKHLQRFPGIPKVYRYTFGRQKSSLALLAKGEKLPVFFQNPCIIDVTGNYDFISPCNFRIHLGDRTIVNTYVYLCVFGVTGWRPVDWSHPQDGYVSFRDVGTDIIYQLCSFSGTEMDPVGFPFLLRPSGEVVPFIPDTANMRTLVLDRKYPPAKHLAKIPFDILGGKIQASDDPGFKKAVNIHSFDRIPSFKYQTVDLKLKKRYRYFRFLAADSSHINMSELELYKTDGTIAKGVVIGNTDRSPYYPSATEDRMFDSDPLSFTYSHSTGRYAGLDLGKPEMISKIRFIIRNDDNGIRKQADYELFYGGNDGWISAGRKTADQDDEITFENVPANAVYWLRNHTKGQEERIFLHKKDTVEWW